MAINKFMMAALKALSYADYNIKDNYKFHRRFNNIIHPPFKDSYHFWEHNIGCRDYELPVRIFPPAEMRSEEIILFFHGGGWVTGNTESYAKPAPILRHKQAGMYILWNTVWRRNTASLVRWRIATLLRKSCILAVRTLC